MHAADLNELAGSALEYCVEQLLIHLDDSSFDIQQCVYKALSAMIELSGASAASIEIKLEMAKASHRDPALCIRLIALARDKK
mmetsp:Transcript_4305/g.13530  ORF Transcript_4305/g.13530 Transcript_4305/m.13530 type:complete len:83 (-) Transcript_4305:120-368(-)